MTGGHKTRWSKNTDSTVRSLLHFKFAPYRSKIPNGSTCFQWWFYDFPEGKSPPKQQKLPPITWWFVFKHTITEFNYRTELKTFFNKSSFSPSKLPSWHHCYLACLHLTHGTANVFFQQIYLYFFLWESHKKSKNKSVEKAECSLPLDVHGIPFNRTF